MIAIFQEQKHAREARMRKMLALGAKMQSKAAESIGSARKRANL